jgi:hypothetical protein
MPPWLMVSQASCVEPGNQQARRDPSTKTLRSRMDKPTGYLQSRHRLLSTLRGSLIGQVLEKGPPGSQIIWRALS